MKIYNTLTRQKEEFAPIEEGKVSMYVCGPTVYNLIHIGNARPMIVFDTFRRYLEYKGYEVAYVSNFTDVDDKIINQAKKEGVDASEISARYIKECKKDMEAMNVKPATVHPLATQEIDGMIEMISSLIEKGYAYRASDGTVYFRTGRFDGYGKLSHKNLEDLQAGHRDIKVTGELKEEPFDFVLWKPKKEGEPAWASPWCEGRPGWHIECSVMSKKYLGETIDIHAGGEDLIFPHHENEIAQSEAASGRPFAHYWMHNGFLNIDNQKMSKSLGNFFTVREIADKYDLQVLRFFMLSAHYRSPLNFSADLMESAKSGLERILTAAENLKRLADGAKAQAAPETGTAQASETGAGQTAAGQAAAAAGQTAAGQAATAAEQAAEAGQTAEAGQAAAAAGQTAAGQTAENAADKSSAQGMTEEEKALYAGAQEYQKKFEAAMDDDCNTADAVSAVFELVKYINIHASAQNTKAYLGSLYDELHILCDVLGILIEREEEILDAEIEQLIKDRQEARKNKDFAKADQIRDELAQKGIILKDTREGVTWKRA